MPFLQVKKILQQTQRSLSQTQRSLSPNLSLNPPLSVKRLRTHSTHGLLFVQLERALCPVATAVGTIAWKIWPCAIMEPIHMSTRCDIDTASVSSVRICCLCPKGNAIKPFDMVLHQSAGLRCFVRTSASCRSVGTQWIGGLQGLSGVILPDPKTRCHSWRA